MRHVLIGLAALLWPALALAQSEKHDAFVEANILGVFYHELGHAVIDIEGVPIFGQEEDAADVFSIYLIHTMFEEEPAQSLAYDTAYGFRAEAEFRAHSGDQTAWWGVHGPTQQRFYNTVCLFYGANPRPRAAFAEKLGLPENRAEYCHVEFDQADRSWGAVLDQMIERGPGRSMSFVGDTSSVAGDLLSYEVDQLNRDISFAAPLEVTVESCGVANAFYMPAERTIIFCSEFEEYFREMARWLL